MLRHIAVALSLSLSVAAPASAQTKMLQGGVQQNAPPAAPPTQQQVPPDEFNSNGDDKRPYISKDGRWFDRCAYERDHPGVWDQMYGKPDVVQISRISSEEARKRYVRCAVNSCDPQNTAVCWRNPTPPTDNGTSSYPGYPDRDPTPVVPPYTPPVPGGYDPCANPNAWRIPQCQGAALPKPVQPPPQVPCENIPDPAAQQTLRRTGNELLDTFAAMGSQADNMLTHFGRATVAQVNLLLHPDQLAAGVQQSAETAVTFLANQDPAKWAMLRDRAIEAFRRDPSGAVGDVGANAFTGELIGGACSAGTAGARTLAAKVAMTERATGSLKKIVDNMKRAEGSQGEVVCGPTIAKAGNPDLTNPFWDRTNCVPSTIAGALRDFDGKPWTAVDVVTRYPRGAEVMEKLNAGQGLKGPLMYDMMRYYFGTVVPKGLSVERLMDQLFGVPSQMSRRAIETELLQAGPGSGGMVFVHFMQDWVEKQHVFKATNEGGAIRYVDNQRALEGSYNFTDAISVFFFRYR